MLMTPLITLEEMERQTIERALRLCSTLVEAADRLGIDIATLYRKRRRFGLGRVQPAPGQSLDPDMMTDGAGI